MLRIGGKAVVVGCLAAGVGFAGAEDTEPAATPSLVFVADRSSRAAPQVVVEPAPAAVPGLTWTTTRSDGLTWTPSKSRPLPLRKAAHEPVVADLPPIPQPAIPEPIVPSAPLSLLKPSQTLPPKSTMPEPIAPPRTAKPIAPTAPPTAAPPDLLPSPPKDVIPAPRSAAEPHPLPVPKPAPRSRPLLAAEDLPPPPNGVSWGPSESAECGPACAPLVSQPYATPPVRHGTFGSPDLAVSRDYHFLDFFCPPGMFGDSTDTVILNEGAAYDRSFVQAEYLLWWVKPGSIPALATTSTAGRFGFLGAPDTRTLLGPGRFGQSSRNGFRVRAGHWFGDDCATPRFGIDGSYFFLGSRADTFAAGSNQFPVLTRPFFAPNAGPANPPAGFMALPGEFGEQVAFPGLSTGTLVVMQESRLWGADVNLRKAVCRSCDTRKEWFAGYRYLNLNESLTMTESLTAVGAPNDPPGTRIQVADSFVTRTQFHGAQAGWTSGRTVGSWDFDVRASVALGVSHQEVDINGGQVRTRPGQASEAFRGGLLATGPNLGSFQQNEFAVVPEAIINAGYRVSPGLRAYVGYTFLYWSSVARPGEQIDRVVDITAVPNFDTGAVPSGQARPRPTFAGSGFWAQGIQFGLDYRW